MIPGLQGQNCTFFTTTLSRNFHKRLEHQENQTKTIQKSQEGTVQYSSFTVNEQKKENNYKLQYNVTGKCHKQKDIIYICIYVFSNNI